MTMLHKCPGRYIPGVYAVAFERLMEEVAGGRSEIPLDIRGHRGLYCRLLNIVIETSSLDVMSI